LPFVFYSMSTKALNSTSPITSAIPPVGHNASPPIALKKTILSKQKTMKKQTKVKSTLIQIQAIPPPPIKPNKLFRT